VENQTATEARIIALYRGKYEGFNFRHFLEKLSEEEGISISYEPLRRILTSAGFKSPKRPQEQGRRRRSIHQGQGENVSGSFSKSMPRSITGSGRRCRRPPSTGP
jgi:transposase